MMFSAGYLMMLLVANYIESGDMIINECEAIGGMRIGMGIADDEE
jgi:hypothetical protein